MKKILGLACLFASVSAFSATVKITSFNYLRTGDVHGPLAEICGAVEGATAMTFVKVMIDPKASKPAYYNTVVDTDGKFCLVVATYHGTADVSIIGGAKASAKIK